MTLSGFPPRCTPGSPPRCSVAGSLDRGPTDPIALSRRAGAPRGVQPTGPNSVGPHWGRCRNVRVWAPAVTDDSEEPQVVGPPVHAAGMMQVGDSDCVPKVEVGGPSVTPLHHPSSGPTWEDRGCRLWS